jgi:hypothetical protein
MFNLLNYKAMKKQEFIKAEAQINQFGQTMYNLYSVVDGSKYVITFFNKKWILIGPTGVISPVKFSDLFEAVRYFKRVYNLQFNFKQG